MTQNTRHIPDLEAAAECVRQAVTAAKESDTERLDMCVTAALQYLQPDVEHVKAEPDEPLVRVHIGLAGERGTVASKPVPLSAGVQEIDRLNLLAEKGHGVYTLHLSQEPVNYSAQLIREWFLSDYESNPPL